MIVDTDDVCNGDSEIILLLLCFLNMFEGVVVIGSTSDEPDVNVG